MLESTISLERDVNRGAKEKRYHASAQTPANDFAALGSGMVMISGL